MGDLLWLIDLHIVIRTWQEEELRRGKQFMKAPGHADIQVRVARDEDDAHWWSERLHLRDPLRPISHREEEVLIQAKESGLGTGRGRKLVIEQGQELLTVGCLAHESADLPPIQLAEEPIVKGFQDGARNVSHQRCGIQQDECSHTIRMSKRPINGWWARSVVCDQHDLLEVQLLNDGVQVRRLIAGGVGIASGLLGCAPSEKIKRHDPARAGQPGEETIVEMQIVWEAMHQDDGRLLPWILTRIQVRGTALYDMFSVG